MNAQEIIRMLSEEAPIGRVGTSPAVAANNSVVAMSTGINSIVRVRKMEITNDTVAFKSYTYHVGRIDTFPAGVTLVSQAAFAECAGRRYYPDASGSQSNAMLWNAYRAGTFGATIGKVNVPPGSSVIIEFPEPGIVLIGESATGPAGIAVINTTLNDPCIVGFFGLESAYSPTPVTSR